MSTTTLGQVALRAQSGKQRSHPGAVPAKVDPALRAERRRRHHGKGGGRLRLDGRVLRRAIQADLQVHEVQGLRGQEGAHEEAERGVQVGVSLPLLWCKL